jgi:hypothetical protein
MGKFKEFLAKKEELKKRKPREETVFGERPEKKPREEKQPVSESTVSPKLKVVNIPKLTTEQHVKLHEAAKPDSMRDDHVKALNNYTNDSKAQNSALIKFDNGSEISGSKKEEIHRTDAALEPHKTKADMTLYTGVKRSPARHFTRGQDEVEVHHPAFISASTCFHIAKGFSEAQSHPNNEKMGVHLDEKGAARHVLALHVPKGTNGVSTRGHSFLPGEHEVLLARGHEFAIHHKPTIHVDEDGTKYHVWHAKVSGHYPADIDQEDL